MSFHKYLLDMLYPENLVCPGCSTTYVWSELNGICHDCLKKVEFIQSFCPRCGRLKEVNTLCSECRGGSWFFNQSRSIALYRGKMRDFILKYKYYHQLDLVNPLSKLMFLYYQYYYSDLKIDLIIPVPLHKMRLEQRGFNQAELLAEKLAEKTGIYFSREILTRVRNTMPLYNLSSNQRRKVIQGCFEINSKRDLSDKNLLLVDDIFTTGSTVNEISRLIKEEYQSTEVYVLTLASGSKK